MGESEGINGERYPMKWAYLTTAPDQLTAEMWREILRDEGIPATLESSDAVSFLGISSFPCRLMVQKDRQQEAEAILAEYIDNI